MMTFVFTGKIRRAKGNIEHLGSQIVSARQVSEFVERGVHYGSDLEIYEAAPMFQIPLQECVEMANSLDVHDALRFENIGVAIASTKEQMIQLIDSLCFIQNSIPVELPLERRPGMIGNGQGSGGNGEMSHAHGVCMLFPVSGLTTEPWLFVNDRSNFRIQVFNAVTGKWFRACVVYVRDRERERERKREAYKNRLILFVCCVSFGRAHVWM